MPHMPIIMKGGSYNLWNDGQVGFNSSSEMLMKLMLLADIEQAEATVESDKNRILDSIRNTCGIAELNKVIRGIMSGGATIADISYSSIIQCAACGDSEAIKKVMANPNSILGVSACDYTALLEKQISAGFDANRTNFGSPLTYAAMGGHVHAVKLLLSVPNIVFGPEALPVAAMNGHTQVVEMLAAKGVDINRNDGGMSTITFAAIGGHTDCVKSLINLGAKSEHFPEALYGAIKLGYLETSKLLIENGKDLNYDYKHSDGTTILNEAVQSGNIEAVKLLLSTGVDVNLKDDSANSALTLAIKMARDDIAGLLKDHGATE